jgi:hypothetical protein
VKGAIRQEGREYCTVLMLSPVVNAVTRGVSDPRDQRYSPDAELNAVSL